MKPQEAWKVLGANIRRLRKAAGVTQEDLASQVGVTPPRISQIENGVKDTTVSLIVDIAEALHEPVDMLFRTEKTVAVEKQTRTVA